MAFVDTVLGRLAPKTRARDLAKHRRELQTLDREIANLTAAIAQGEALPPLLAALTTRQARREDLTATITAQAAVVDVARIPRAAIERKVQARLAARHARLMRRRRSHARDLARDLHRADRGAARRPRVSLRGRTAGGEPADGLIGETYVVRPARLRSLRPRRTTARHKHAAPSRRSPRAFQRGRRRMARPALLRALRRGISALAPIRAARGSERATASEPRERSGDDGPPRVSVLGSPRGGAFRLRMARPAGLEPATPGLEGRCSIH